MRIDYTLYFVAAICLVIAVYTAFAVNEVTPLYIAVLAILGIVFVGLGYMSRSKSAPLSSAAVKESASLELPKPPKPQPKPKPEPKKEPEKPKKGSRKKTTRKRRKKT